MKLYKGSITPAGRKSLLSLYREDFATFGMEDVYNQTDAKGFIRLFGLPLKVDALKWSASIRSESIKTRLFTLSRLIMKMWGAVSTANLTWL